MHLGSCGKKLLSVGSESITEGQVGAAALVRLRTGVPADNQEAAGCTGPAEGPESGARPSGGSRGPTFPGVGILGLRWEVSAGFT